MQQLSSIIDLAAIVAVLNATIRGAIPIILGALGGIVSERSGIVNIGIEGMMLSGAFAAFAANVYLSQKGVPTLLELQPIRLALSLLAAIIAGAGLALLHALLSIRYKVDQIISGTVINLFALGVTSYLYIGGAVTHGGLPLIPNPFNEDQGAIYFLGKLIFEKSVLTYATFALVFILGFALFRTTWGLRTRAVGENPRAADTLGVNVHRLQYTNLAISGLLAGLAGAALIQGVSFERNMSDGRGFIALAVMIFGVWRPSRVLVGALLFGFATALQSQLQLSAGAAATASQSSWPYILAVPTLALIIFGLWRPGRILAAAVLILVAAGLALLYGFATALQGQLQFSSGAVATALQSPWPYMLVIPALALIIFGLWRPGRILVAAVLVLVAASLQLPALSGLLVKISSITIPHQFIEMLPYVLTLVVLAGFVGRARPPAHIGQAYEVE